MSSRGFLERILEIDSAGAALGNSTAETSLLPSKALTAYLPAGYFDYLGKVLGFKFTGQISNRVTGPDTFKFKLYVGSVAVLDTGLIPLNTTAKTNVHWTLSGDLVAQAIGGGTATQLMPSDVRFKSESVIGSPAATAGGSGEYLLPYNTAPVLGSGFDNGPSALVDLKGIHSFASASNTIQMLTGRLFLYT
jgi:hypothetical protein